MNLYVRVTDSIIQIRKNSISIMGGALRIKKNGYESDSHTHSINHSVLDKGG